MCWCVLSALILQGMRKKAKPAFLNRNSAKQSSLDLFPFGDGLLGLYEDLIDETKRRFNSF
jgi:hypothetical protein